MRATVFQSYIPNSCSRARARARATSASCHNRADGREAPGRKIHFSILRAGVQLAVPRWKITKKKRRIDRRNRPTSITLYYTTEPSSLRSISWFFVDWGSLSLFPSLFPSLFYGEYTSGQRQRAADRWKKSKRETERDEKIDGEEREVQRDAEEREARNGNHEKRQRIISIIDPDGRTHALAHAECRASVCAALRFIAAPLTGGLRPSKGCACGYVHNTVHRRMHVGPWMRRRARWPRERETPRAQQRVCACARHLRRGVNDDGGTTTRVAGRNCEVAPTIGPLGICTR